VILNLAVTIGKRVLKHGPAARTRILRRLQHRGSRRNAVGNVAGRDSGPDGIVRRLLSELGVAAFLRFPPPDLGRGPVSEQAASRLPADATLNRPGSAGGC
jgi:hypothetical protein